MFRLYNDSNIHFRHTDKKTCPDWYTYSLLTWEDYPAMYDVYKRNYDVTGISWVKCTHMRTHGSDQLSRSGATKDQVGGHTKHGNESLQVNYWTELPPETQHILAGFKKMEAYFVDRWYINFNNVDFPLVEGRTDLTREELVTKLIPQYPIWLQQHEQAQGLKWPCGTNFLKQTIPLLAVIFVQDGIFRVNALPRNESSRLLVHAFGQRYKEWASRQRVWIKDLNTVENRARIQALNQDSQNAIVSLKGDNIGITNKLDQILKNQERQHQPQQQLLQPQQRRPTTESTQPRLMRTLVSECPLELSNSLPPPLIPKELPATFEDLLKQHLEHDLEKYKGVSKKGEAWQSVKMQLCRRNFLYELIQKGATGVNLRGTLEHRQMVAARQLDEDRTRNSMSLPVYLTAMKKRVAKKRKVTTVPGGRKRRRQVIQFRA
jgi:hypothetical protein